MNRGSSWVDSAAVDPDRREPANRFKTQPRPSVEATYRAPLLPPPTSPSSLSNSTMGLTEINQPLSGVMQPVRAAWAAVTTCDCGDASDRPQDATGGQGSCRISSGPCQTRHGGLLSDAGTSWGSGWRASRIWCERNGMMESRRCGPWRRCTGGPSVRGRNGPAASLRHPIGTDSASPMFWPISSRYANTTLVTDGRRCLRMSRHSVDAPPDGIGADLKVLLGWVLRSPGRCQ